MRVWKAALGAVAFLWLSSSICPAQMVGRWVGQWNDAVRSGAMDLTFSANGTCSGTIVDYPGLFGPGYSTDIPRDYVVTGTYTYDMSDRRITFELHGGGPWFSSHYTAYGEGTVHGATADGTGGLTIVVQIGGGMSSSVQGRSWSLATLQVPNQATNPSPADGSTVVLFQNLILRWQPVSLAEEYEVYFGTSPNFTSVQPIAVVTQPQHALLPLQENTVYYWRVDTTNDNGTTTGQVWSFRTAILPWIVVDQGQIDFIGEQTGQTLAISNATNTMLHYDLILLTGGAYFRIADPNQGVSTGPSDLRNHTIYVNREAILPGQTVTGRMAVVSTLAPNSPIEVVLAATGWDVQANFDMLFRHTLPAGIDEFIPSEQQTVPVWRLDLTNNNPLDGPSWDIDGVTFAANNAFINAYPDPNQIDSTGVLWGAMTLDPAQTARIEAQGSGPVQSARIPFYVTRTMVKNRIVDGGKMITRVVVTPQIALSDMDVEIRLSTLMEEPVEGHSVFAVLAHDANSCSHVPQWISHAGDKYTDQTIWHLESVGLEPVTFQVSHIVDVNEPFFSALLTPEVTVSGIPADQDMMPSWQGDVLHLDNGRYVRVHSNACLNFFQGKACSSGFSLQMPYVIKVSPISDITVDGRTDLQDLALFSEWWLADPCDPNNMWCQRTDFTRDGMVGLSDFARLSADWTVLQPEVLFEDSFSDGNTDGWTVHDTGTLLAPSAWSVFSGILQQTSNIYSNPTAPSTLLKDGTYLGYDGGSAWSDYTVQCTIRSRGFNDCGVMFRVQDENNYYRFNWNRAAGYSRLIKVVGGVATLLDSVDTGYAFDVTYDVEVRALGDQLAVTIDGVPLLEAVDAELASGTIGLYTWGNAPVAYFDDVSVIGW